MVQYLSHISIEKYSAYLDGNLTNEEMQQIDVFVHNESEMQAVVASGNYFDIISNTVLYDNVPVPFEIELPTIELSTFDAGLPFEPNNFIDDFLPIDSGGFGEEFESLMNDGESHHGLLDEITRMNSLLEEDNPIRLAASEDEGGLNPDAPYDWSIHDGDYGFLEMGLPPIITQDDLTNNELTTSSVDDEV